jgi:hypothetical protein
MALQGPAAKRSWLFASIDKFALIVDIAGNSAE